MLVLVRVVQKSHSHWSRKPIIVGPEKYAAKYHIGSVNDVFYSVAKKALDSFFCQILFQMFWN